MPNRPGDRPEIGNVVQEESRDAEQQGIGQAEAQGDKTDKHSNRGVDGRDREQVVGQVPFNFARDLEGAAFILEGRHGLHEFLVEEVSGRDQKEGEGQGNDDLAEHFRPALRREGDKTGLADRNRFGRWLARHLGHFPGGIQHRLDRPKKLAHFPLGMFHDFGGVGEALGERARRGIDDERDRREGADRDQSGRKAGPDAELSERAADRTEHEREHQRTDDRDEHALGHRQRAEGHNQKNAYDSPLRFGPGPFRLA